MSRSWTFRVDAHSPAPPSEVFAVLADGARWADWAGRLVPRSAWERTGEDAPGGVGAVRLLGRRPFATREEVVEYEPDRRLAWVVRGGGLPVRDYWVTVELRPAPLGGSATTWTGRFRPLVPGTGRFLRLGLRLVVRGFAVRLAAAAGRRQAEAWSTRSSPGQGDPGREEEA